MSNRSLLICIALGLGPALVACDTEKAEPLEVVAIRQDGDGVAFTTIYRGAHMDAVTLGNPKYSYNFELLAFRCPGNSAYPAAGSGPVQIRLLPLKEAAGPAAEVTATISCFAEYTDVRGDLYGRVNWAKSCLNFSSGWHTGADVNAFTAPGAIAAAKQICGPIRRRAKEANAAGRSAAR